MGQWLVLIGFCVGGVAGGGIGVVGFESDVLEICVVVRGRLWRTDVVGGGHCFGLAFGVDCAKEDGSSMRVIRGATNPFCGGICVSGYVWWEC